MLNKKPNRERLMGLLKKNNLEDYESQFLEKTTLMNINHASKKICAFLNTEYGGYYCVKINNEEKNKLEKNLDQLWNDLKKYIKPWYIAKKYISYFTIDNWIVFDIIPPSGKLVLFSCYVNNIWRFPYREISRTKYLGENPEKIEKVLFSRAITVKYATIANDWKIIIDILSKSKTIEDAKRLIKTYPNLEYISKNDVVLLKELRDSILIQIFDDENKQKALFRAISKLINSLEYLSKYSEFIPTSSLFPLCFGSPKNTPYRFLKAGENYGISEIDIILEFFTKINKSILK